MKQFKVQAELVTRRTVETIIEAPDEGTARAMALLSALPLWKARRENPAIKEIDLVSVVEVYDVPQQLVFDFMHK